MPDPRLNSVHLESQRREEFRHAREALLDARGDLTQIADEKKESGDSPGLSPTLIQQMEGRLPPGQHFALLDKEAIYPLKVGINTVGRMPDNDVVLRDPFVSRRHCAVLVHASDGCELHDVASKNGTYLNGRRLAGPTPLFSGDEIRMCDRQLIFVSDIRLDDARDERQTHLD